jgi:hypothetical protein
MAADPPLMSISNSLYRQDATAAQTAHCLEAGWFLCCADLIPWCNLALTNSYTIIPKYLIFMCFMMLLLKLLKFLLLGLQRIHSLLVLACN